MKLAYDIVRELLITLEESPKDHMYLGDFGEVEKYHLMRMQEANLIAIDVWDSHIFHRKTYIDDAGEEFTKNVRSEGSVSLTWHGHDYLDAVRSETVWQETRQAVAETGGNAAFEIVKALAIGFAKQKIAKHTGIEI